MAKNNAPQAPKIEKPTRPLNGWEYSEDPFKGRFVDHDDDNPAPYQDPAPSF